MMGKKENTAPVEHGNVNPQMDSPFFQRLPPEIRDLVWVQVFSSTRIAVGYLEFPLFHFAKVKPARHSLAALRVCRRARLEIGDCWLRHVRFDFPGIQTMFKKLSVLPVDTLTNLRHVRVSGEQYLRAGNGPDKTRYFYNIDCALSRLPGLQLDQLTILGSRGWSNYIDLLGLIQFGNGWKTLRYLDRSSALLGSRADTGTGVNDWGLMDEYIRKPQPSSWKHTLEERDGISSSPSVTIYRAKESTSSGVMFDPARRVKFEQLLGEGGRTYHPDDAGLMVEERGRRRCWFL
ncbi:hypothetical protein B0J18DRAFT_230704 [Chaetomium sp. MPI-SDFR-AT-0129]|nr:hypothetical protein B0J18DRAFT_230704 [Chaetomium sp. MPI-SDFR-AT-0129]